VTSEEKNDERWSEKKNVGQKERTSGSRSRHITTTQQTKLGEKEEQADVELVLPSVSEMRSTCMRPTSLVDSVRSQVEPSNVVYAAVR